MRLIPVIDLMRGQVVRGERGARATYRPIVSALCGSSDPLRVACMLCEHVDARQLYVADLDALQGGAVQLDVLASLLIALPEVEFWLDAGFAHAAQAAALHRALGHRGARVTPVFGSESLRDRGALEEAFLPAAGTKGSAHGALLSLDRRDGSPLDAAGCWEAPALWPARVIVMTLERVGSGAGPDLATLADVRRRAPTAQLFGAGGIRDEADLAAAGASGAAGWLVASALHDRRLPAARAGRVPA